MHLFLGALQTVFGATLAHPGVQQLSLALVPGSHSSPCSIIPFPQTGRVAPEAKLGVGASTIRDFEGSSENNFVPVPVPEGVGPATVPVPVPEVVWVEVVEIVLVGVDEPVPVPVPD